LNGQAITAGASINTGSLGSTTITGSLLVSGSGLTVTGSVAATTYADIGYGALDINPNAPVLLGSMISGSVWYSPATDSQDRNPRGFASFRYSTKTNYNEIVIVLDDSRVFDNVNPLDFTRYATIGDFGYPSYFGGRPIVNVVHIINASNSSQFFNYRTGFNSTTATFLSAGQAGSFPTIFYTDGVDTRLGFDLATVKYTRGQLARHTATAAKALILDPVTSITTAIGSPFSSSYANKLPQGTVYFNSNLKTLGVAISNDVTASVVLSSYTGSVDISGSVTVTGSLTLNGQAITAGSSINTGSLGSTTITGSLRVTGSGLTVTGSLVASGSTHTIIGTTIVTGSLFIADSSFFRSQAGLNIWENSLNSVAGASVAIGSGNTSVQRGLVVGTGNTTSTGVGNIAMGANSTATSTAGYGIALGYGANSTALGQVAVGSYNNTSATANFIVGNGAPGATSTLLEAGGSTVQITGSLNVSGSITVSGSALLSLRPQDPLPAAASNVGAFATSGSGVNLKPYFSNGTSWNALY